MTRAAVLRLGLVVVVLAAMTADAGLVSITVQDIPFNAYTPDVNVTKDNKFNNAFTYFDEDSGFYKSSIVNDADNSGGPTAGDTSVGAAFNVMSGNPDLAGQMAYFGGIFRFQEINDSATAIPSNREVTGKFYNMQTQNIGYIDTNGNFQTALPGSTHNNVKFHGIDAAGNYNVSWAVVQSKYSFAVEFAEGTKLELWVDDPNTGTAYVTVSSDQPVNYPDVVTNVNYQTGVETGNTPWHDATDSVVYPGQPLLQATIEDPVVAEVTLERTGDGFLKYVATTEIKEDDFVVTGGALEPYVNPFGNPEELPGGPVRDGYFFSTNYKFVGHLDPTLPSGGSAGISDWVAQPANWVGIGGGVYAIPTAQPAGSHCEFKDDFEVHVNLQTPDPATAAFFAPVLFGFVGYAVRRRRMRR
jgi:hypothetical protein